MAIDLDREARMWAARIARAYALASAVQITPETEAWIVRELHAPMAECLGAAIPSIDWADDFVNPALRHWESVSHRAPGPRAARFDYANGTVTVGW